MDDPKYNNILEKSFEAFYHIVFLEFCNSFKNQLVLAEKRCLVLVNEARTFCCDGRES